MIKLVVNNPCNLEFHGESYTMHPITPPHIDPANILLCHKLLSKFYFTKRTDYPFLNTATFDEKKIPGFPMLMTEKADRLPENTRLLIIYFGAYGDLLMLTPALKALKERISKDSEIWLSVPADRHCLFESLGPITKLLPYPLRLSEMLAADYYIDFEGADLNNLNMTDMFLDMFHIDFKSIKDKLPVVDATLTESGRIKGIFEEIRRDNDAPIVLCALLAGSPSRNLPSDMIKVLIDKFPDVNFLIPRPDVLNYRRIENLRVYYINTYDKFSDLITSVALSDAVFSADTCTCHIAAGLEKPSLVVFGSIMPELRTRYYQKNISVAPAYSGKLCNSPCGLHSELYVHPDHPIFKKAEKMGLKPDMNGCPEAKYKGTFYSPCLLSISDEVIVDKFGQLLNMIEENE